MEHRDLLAVTDTEYNIPRTDETEDLALLPNSGRSFQFLPHMTEFDDYVGWCKGLIWFG